MLSFPGEATSHFLRSHSTILTRTISSVTRHTTSRIFQRLPRAYPSQFVPYRYSYHGHHHSQDYRTFLSRIHQRIIQSRLYTTPRPLRRLRPPSKTKTKRLFSTNNTPKPPQLPKKAMKPTPTPVKTTKYTHINTSSSHLNPRWAKLGFNASPFKVASSGFAGGTLGAFCGVGGGMVMIPLMHHFTRMTAQQIAG